MSKSSDAVESAQKASAIEEAEMLFSELKIGYYEFKYTNGYGNTYNNFKEYAQANGPATLHIDDDGSFTYQARSGEVTGTISGDNVEINGATSGGSVGGNSPVTNYTINFTAENGTVSQSSIGNVPNGAIINVNGEAITITKEGTTIGTVTATAEEATGYITTFSSWNCTDGQTITGAMTITATYTRAVAGLMGQALSIGDEVTVGGEQFFVMKASAASEENVTLLAKYNLNQEGTEQLNASRSDTACIFSSDQYWEDFQEDINTCTNYEEGDAQAKCILYGTAKGGTGRLMTNAEAETLRTQNSNILYGNNYITGPTTDGKLEYWLGTGYLFVSRILCILCSWYRYYL